MTKYDWNKDTIENIENDYLRNVILSEYNKEIFSEDSTILKELSVRAFKHAYYEELRRLTTYNKELATISDLLPFTLKGKKIQVYKYPHQNFTADIVLEIIKSFIITLGDDELLKYFNILIDPNNHILRIEDYNPDIPITEYIRGRLIHQDNNTYLSYYLKDNITDIPSLMHEISHYFASLFKTNPHFQTFFCEFEAKFMEYLIIRYMIEKMGDEELGTILMQEQIYNIMADIHISFYQRLVANTLSNQYNEEKTLKRFNKELGLELITPPTRKIILNDGINIVKGRIHSGMLALAFTDKIGFDYQEGTELYKSILTDPENNFNALLKKYNLNYQEYVDTFAIYTNPDLLGKRLKK